MVLVISNSCSAAFLKDTFTSHKIPVCLPFQKRLGVNMSCTFCPSLSAFRQQKSPRLAICCGLSDYFSSLTWYLWVASSKLFEQTLSVEPVCVPCEEKEGEVV